MENAFEQAILLLSSYIKEHQEVLSLDPCVIREKEEINRILAGAPESLQSRIDAARCTESLSRYIELNGYRGERNV